MKLPGKQVRQNIRSNRKRHRLQDIPEFSFETFRRVGVDFDLDL